MQIWASAAVRAVANMDGLEDSVKEDLQELHTHVSDISSWLPRFLSYLRRYESLPSPTEFPRVVASIGREFKVILADIKSRVPVMKRVETLKGRVWPHLAALGERKASAGASKQQEDILAVDLQLLELKWERTCVLVSGGWVNVPISLPRLCIQLCGNLMPFIRQSWSRPDRQSCSGCVFCLTCMLCCAPGHKWTSMWWLYQL